MLTSDIAVKFNRRLGFLSKKKIDMSKLLNLSRDIYDQYLSDKKIAKKRLAEQLHKAFDQIIEDTQTMVIKEEERRYKVEMNKDYLLQFGQYLSVEDDDEDIPSTTRSKPDEDMEGTTESALNKDASKCTLTSKMSIKNKTPISEMTQEAIPYQKIDVSKYANMNMLNMQEGKNLIKLEDLRKLVNHQDMKHRLNQCI